MNKAQLVDAIAEEIDLPKTVVVKTMDSMIEKIFGVLKEGDTVSLVGFGTFSVKTRAARVGRNPKTGEEIQIEEARVPAFKAGKALKEAVNEVALMD